MHVTHIERAYVSKNSIYEGVVQHRNLGGTAELLNLSVPVLSGTVFLRIFYTCPQLCK